MTRVDVDSASVRVRELDLRIPFSFGETTLTSVPHVVARTELGDGTVGQGASNLVPKWFAKDPDESVTDDLGALRDVVLAAADGATALDPAPSVFDFWRRLVDRQADWAGSDHPPLRWHTGVALVERAVIDAVCRREGETFHGAVRSGTLGIEPGRVHDELTESSPDDLLPAEPRRSLTVRHTVGHSDPLTPDELDESGDDWLPRALTECIDRYGLTHFKLKAAGDPAADADRLRSIAGVVDERVADPVFTLDANEQYESIADLESLWDRIRADEALNSIENGLSTIEQPFPRDLALADSVGEALSSWTGPPVIIDESDGLPADLERALDLGYAGTSVKSCKGVCKSVVNACLLANRRQRGKPGVCTAEDLTTVGPIDLLQDLTLVATLGIDHVERNGHHYLRGLAPFESRCREHALRHHSDVYREGPAGVPTLAIDDGQIATDCAVDAPYGVAGRPHYDGFEPLNSWEPAA